jgi:hypothetical protein
LGDRASESAIRPDLPLQLRAEVGLVVDRDENVDVPGPPGAETNGLAQEQPREGLVRPREVSAVLGVNLHPERGRAVEAHQRVQGEIDPVLEQGNIRHRRRAAVDDEWLGVVDERPGPTERELRTDPLRAHRFRLAGGLLYGKKSEKLGFRGTTATRF